MTRASDKSLDEDKHKRILRYPTFMKGLEWARQFFIREFQEHSQQLGHIGISHFIFRGEEILTQRKGGSFLEVSSRCDHKCLFSRNIHSPKNKQLQQRALETHPQTEHLLFGLLVSRSWVYHKVDLFFCCWIMTFIQ